MATREPAVNIPEPAFGAWLALAQAYTALARRFENGLQQQVGMSLSWFQVLVVLYSQGGRMQLVDLSTELGVSRPSVTKLVDRMEAGGVVRRERSGRTVYAALTTAGQKAWAEALPVQTGQVIDVMGDHLDDDQLTRLHELLGLLRDGVRADDRRGDRTQTEAGTAQK